METAKIGIGFQRRRFSYFDKLIADEDIPLEELNHLEPTSDQKNAEMNIYSQPPVAGHFDMRSAGSEFETEAYLEYRRRVFEQLAEDYEKDQQTVTEEIKPIYEDENQTQLHSSHQQTAAGELTKIQSDLQASWDDSDLKSEAYFSSSQTADDNPTLFWQMDQESKPLVQDNHIAVNNAALLDGKINQNLLSNWSSFEDQIAKVQKEKSSSSEASNQLDKSDKFVFGGRTRRSSRNSFQKQKLDRELIRKKLSMPDPDEEDTSYGGEKPWQQPRFERSYSSSNQSLQICYINESCSSDESENNSSGEKSQTAKETNSSSASPTASPYFASPRGYGKGYMRQHRLSDASSPTSSLSSLSTTTNSDSTIIHHSHHDLRSGRSKHEEMELEARYQLAQAYQRAKEQAEEDRQKNKLTKNSSIVHKLLSVSLNDDINAKIKAFTLSKHDCRQMTMGQLQLILNDMHTKKQALNEGLVTLLVERDELQTQQDAKLVDIEDMKAILNSLGPETTV
uniref:Uncharacterized protein LOC100187054 n=1 Tax=Phallusia mammillata TaxID=59560 RepID=A0A6F9DJB3_9ASCI|nr:uncharacterized protein LOC100187054 [Phallusia mammillata]